MFEYFLLISGNNFILISELILMKVWKRDTIARAVVVEKFSVRDVIAAWKCRHHWTLLNVGIGERRFGISSLQYIDGGQH